MKTRLLILLWFVIKTLIALGVGMLLGMWLVILFQQVKQGLEAF